MYQYNDNTFSKVKPLSEISEELYEARHTDFMNNIKAIHFGNSEEELETRKAEILNQLSVDEVNKRVEGLEKTVNEIAIKTGIAPKDKILVVKNILPKG